jgi:RodZ C-terminal domain
VWQLTRPEERTVVTVAAARRAPQKPTPVEPVAAVHHPAPPARLVLSAARGACWLEVRARAKTGRVLYAGTLAQGGAVAFTRRRLWLAFGAGGNLDATLNGRAVDRFPAGTAAVAVTARGIGRPASL